MTEAPARPGRPISWLALCGVGLYTLSAARFVVLFIMHPSANTAGQAIFACALGAAIWWVILKIRRGSERSPAQATGDVAIRRAVYWMVAADTVVLLVFMWLVVRKGVQLQGITLALLPILFITNGIFVAVIARRVQKKKAVR